MYGIKTLLSINRLLTTKVKTSITSLKNTQKSYSKAISSFDVKSQVKEDVVLYTYENPKFFIALNIFSTLHCLIWGYLGVFLSQSLKKAPDNEDSQKKFWGNIIEKERKHIDILTAFSLGFGVIICASTFVYSIRSIRKLILHKGGRNLTVVTYNLPGYNTLNVSLNNVSSCEHRTKAKKYIPLHIKDKIFYYLLDVRGEFYNPELFDFTAGLKRDLKR